MVFKNPDEMGGAFETGVERQFVDVFIGNVKELPGILQLFLHEPSSRRSVESSDKISFKRSQAAPCKLGKFRHPELVDKISFHDFPDACPVRCTAPN